uniref:Unannotated protein n=1 Tax=freshwater metagenome TaxID=449393 RepID=A0A6J5ZW98_9ZZZZ
MLNAVFLGGTQGLVLLQGLIVTVLLGPSDIGLYGIVTVTAMSIVELRRVGIDEGFVQQNAANQEQEFEAAFTLELAVGLVAALLIAVSAPIIALVYGQPELLPLCLAVAYLPVAFALQAPQWIFFRRMEYLRLRLLQAAIPAVTFAVTVPLAASGVGVWALVIGPLAGNLVGIAAAVAVSPYRLRLRRDKAAWRRYLNFSSPIFLTSLGLLVMAQGQIALVGIPEGLAWAGFMTVALMLTRYADRADQIVATTIYPAICAIPGRTAAMVELFEKSNRLTLVWTVPFCASLVLFANDLVDYILGSEWQRAVPLIVGLAIATAVQQLGYNWFSFFRAAGEAKPQAIETWTLVAVFLLLGVPGFLIFGVWGFVVGRVAASCAMVAVRRLFMGQLLPGARLAPLAAGAGIPVLLAALPIVVIRVLVGADRTALWAVGELVLWCALLAALFLRRERALWSELRGYLANPEKLAA